VLEVIRGAQTKKLKERGFVNLPSHGIGKARTKEEWQCIFTLAESAGFITELHSDGFTTLTFADKGHL